MFPQNGVMKLYKGRGKVLRNKCSSYRPLSFLSVPGKVFANVLLSRLPITTLTPETKLVGFQ